MLAERGMLVSLRITQLGLSTKSQEVTTAAHQAYNITDNRAGYYRKFKIDRVDVKDISRIANQARSYHRQMTVPWGHDMYRLLPSTLIPKYNQRIKSLKMEFESNVSDLKVKWTSVIEAAKSRLGPAFKADEYPDVSEVEKFYTFEMHRKPIPQDDHFILKVEQATLDEIKQDLIEEQDKNLKQISQNLWDRMYELVERMAERLSDKDPKIFKTLVSNLEDLVDILPDLNVANDPKLTELCTDVKQKLIIFTPGQLKKDKKVRDKTAQEARDIQNKMEVLMGKK